MVMTAHVVFAALDSKRPATLSPEVIGMLRDKLGFRGVIATDDLDMRAIRMGADEAAIAAVRAGCDALLVCQDERNALLAEEALIREAERDGAFRGRVGEAAARVRALKRSHADAVAKLPVLSRASIASAAHRRLASHLAGG